MFRFTLVTLIALELSATISAFEPRKKPNELFITVDDLNHWVGHHGQNNKTRTPNIDRLAKMAITF